MNDRVKSPIFIVDRPDFELACVREFSHSGTQLGPTVSRDERRERIRLAILREHKEYLRWQDTIHTYAEVYERVYGKPIGHLSIEGGREPTHARRPGSIVSGPYVMVHEETDEEEGEANEEEDDEAV
jgi:hypothetical protein